MLHKSRLNINHTSPLNRLPYLETYPDMRRTKKGGRRFDELPFLHADRLEIGPRPLSRALPVMAGILCAPFRFSQLACSHLNPCRRFYALSQNAEQDDTYDTKQLKGFDIS
ncbi:Uncharacterized protein HZ326_23566 [Fusarium oxysporum f. sp. albedinis]|nr:Uncharacterized protein HZ326_23566 [Fusarium oxysporum f. sp. albedinis]